MASFKVLCAIVSVFIFSLQIQHVLSQSFNNYVGVRYKMTYCETDDERLADLANRWATCGNTPGCDAPTVTLQRSDDRYRLVGSYPGVPRNVWITIGKTFSWYNGMGENRSTFGISGENLVETRSWTSRSTGEQMIAHTTFSFGKSLVIRTTQGDLYFESSFAQL